jgi:ankyrin repeat protein
LASSGGHLDLARFLVEHGADAESQEKDGKTPLYSVSSRGDLDLARFLVGHGADAEASIG